MNIGDKATLNDGMECTITEIQDRPNKPRSWIVVTDADGNRREYPRCLFSTKDVSGQLTGEWTIDD